MQKRGTALNVTQEFEPEALALAGALNETRDVGDGEAGIASLNNTEVRVQRGERVVSNLRTCGRKCSDKARFSGAWVTNQSDIGNGLQFEDNLASPTGDSEERETRGFAL